MPQPNDGPTDHQKVALYVLSKLADPEGGVNIPASEAETMASAKKWLEMVSRGMFHVEQKGSPKEDDDDS